jgi:hypothetical protein
MAAQVVMMVAHRQLVVVVVVQVEWVRLAHLLMLEVVVLENLVLSPEVLFFMQQVVVLE